VRPGSGYRVAVGASSGGKPSELNRQDTKDGKKNVLKQKKTLSRAQQRNEKASAFGKRPFHFLLFLGVRGVLAVRLL
jgi:hypothetical protein